MGQRGPSIYVCQACGRLWAIINAPTTRPVVVGESHFKWRAKSWVLCFGVPVRTHHPAALAAYQLGGHDAVEAMCPDAGASTIP